MSLGKDQKPEQTRKPEKKPSVLERAVEIARKYPVLPYIQARSKIREETPCSKTTAHKAYTIAKNQRKEGTTETGAAKEPEIKVVAEKEKTPEFLDKEEVQETITELPEEGKPLVQALLTEGELSAEDMASIFEAANSGIEMFSPKYAPKDKTAKMLGKLWYRPFNKLWAQISEQNPLIAIAIITTIIVYLPALIGAVTEWRKGKKEDKKPENKE
jgi:hypothetical protein